jgi:YesN/AraC family two-component response regulator
MLKKMFEREGFRVATAEDGRKGIKIYENSSIDLVITDLIMPEKEGIETIIALKKIDSFAKIIAISGDNQANPVSYLEMAMKLGAQKAFTKPIKKEMLIGAARELLTETEDTP